MGWEVELNGIPTECALVERVLGQEIDAEMLSFVRTYFRMRRGCASRVESFAQGDPEAELFVDALEALVADHPGIEHRHCRLARRFDWLKWLLIQCADDAPLAVTAIDGESLIMPSARSTQGFPIRWTLPETCTRVERWLSGVERSHLHAAYDPVCMESAGLYKWGNQDPDEAFQWIMDDFNALKRFYGDVCRHGEAVLVVKD